MAHKTVLTVAMFTLMTLPAFGKDEKDKNQPRPQSVEQPGQLKKLQIQPRQIQRNGNKIQIRIQAAPKK